MGISLTGDGTYALINGLRESNEPERPNAIEYGNTEFN